MTHLYDVPTRMLYIDDITAYKPVDLVYVCDGRMIISVVGEHETRAKRFLDFR